MALVASLSGKGMVAPLVIKGPMIVEIIRNYVSYGVSLLEKWRVERPHDTKSHPFTPSPTYAHKSPEIYTRLDLMLSENVGRRTSKEAPLISAVAPVCYECENIHLFPERVVSALEQLGTYEVIFALDPSTDGPEQVIRREIARNPAGRFNRAQPTFWSTRR
jgi:hypothetical protein